MFNAYREFFTLDLGPRWPRRRLKWALGGLMSGFLLGMALKSPAQPPATLPPSVIEPVKIHPHDNDVGSPKILQLAEKLAEPVPKR